MKLRLPDKHAADDAALQCDIGGFVHPGDFHHAVFVVIAGPVFRDGHFHADS